MLSRDSGASVKAEHVYDGFRNTFGENALGIILGIGQFGSSKNWIIQFKSESTFSSSLGKDILIGSQSFTLKDANEYYKSKDKDNNRPFTMVAFFRIHWLPIDYDESNIQEFLVKNASYMKVMEIKKETLLADKRVLYLQNTRNILTN